VGLPLIDAHTVEVQAPPAVVWQALTDWISRSATDRRRSRFAALLGCEPNQVSGVAGEQGSTFPGFRVLHSSPPRELGLAGEHRYSRYSLDFHVEDHGEDGSSLTATTHAAFPGTIGELYKTAVIRSRAHRALMKRLLSGLARRAEDATLSR
jgi:hypothetical protein